MACLVTATLVSQPAAIAKPEGGGPEGGGPGSKPLPGHTISHPGVAPLTIGGRPTRVFQGTHQHAGYVIEAAQAGSAGP